MTWLSNYIGCRAPDTCMNPTGCNPTERFFRDDIAHLQPVNSCPTMPPLPFRGGEGFIGHSFLSIPRGFLITPSLRGSHCPVLFTSGSLASNYLSICFVSAYSFRT